MCTVAQRVLKRWGGGATADLCLFQSSKLKRLLRSERPFSLAGSYAGAAAGQSARARREPLLAAAAAAAGAKALGRGACRQGKGLLADGCCSMLEADVDGAIAGISS